MVNQCWVNIAYIYPALMSYWAVTEVFCYLGKWYGHGVKQIAWNLGKWYGHGVKQIAWNRSFTYQKSEFSPLLLTRFCSACGPSSLIL